MSKIKYYYDTEKCKYEKVETKPIDIILPILGFLASILIFSFIFTYFQIIQSPTEFILRTENEVLEEKYGLLDNELKKLNSMLLVLQERDASIYRVITEADSLPKSLRNPRSVGYEQYQELSKIGISKEALKIISHKMSSVDELKKQMYIQTKSYDEIIVQAKKKSEMLASIPAIQPCNKYTRIASGFGVRIHPILKVRKFHKGIDFAADRGTPVYAAGDGVILKTNKNLGGYGNEIVINHDFGYQTRYAHLQKFLIKRGQKIKRGQLIGYVGNTGSSTGPHLHYEVLKNGKHVNPVHYFFKDLSPEEYEVILKQASEENQSMS